ncbi:MAG TPA: M20/M25/M40 family metallo-hydrolase [Chloroflexi bacterium]|jgi:acetylornithine deacetylase/succinyl-diaminopimelate desuccinylase-like protein|nr:M20/M25/M40 family metallo-hydrolase [Chloroflexota bacterium]
MTRSEALVHQAVDVLRNLVRIDTTNPPGNETEAARYLASLLATADIETRIVESAPGRGNLIARLRGDGTAKPLLLMGHLDVVSADPAEWTHPPFDGEVADGFLWGRGSTDMKQMVAACAVLMLALSRAERPLRRDLLFIATADEERGGRMGMGWLVREMPDLFDVACAINEGGGGALRVNDRLYYTCQTAEKGVCRTVWTARGRGGHASYPRIDTAPLKMSRAVARTSDGYLQSRTTRTMRTALRRIAMARSSHAADRVEHMLDQGRIEDAMLAAGFDRELVERHRPLFYDTVSLTVLEAGDPAHINVIPPTVRAYADGRILPGQTREGYLTALRSRLGENIEVDVYRKQYSPGLESATEAPILEVMNQVIGERCPGATVIPWLCAGSTDAKHLTPRGVPVYGFVPTPPLPDGVEGAGAHANDERFWLGHMPFILEVLHEVIVRYCRMV